MVNLTIEGIRKLAELNLTPECYKIYCAIIEPNIKTLIPNYLRDWQNVETHVNMMAMRHMGIFKTNVSFISIDSDAKEKYGDQLDVDKFNEIKLRSFKWKIDYLLREQILGKASHELLDLLRNKRNKIHEMGTVFSDKDLREFSMGYSVVFYLYTVETPNSTEEERLNIRQLVEGWAEEALKFVKM